MRDIKKLVAVLAVAALSTLGLAACSSDGPAPSEEPTADGGTDEAGEEAEAPAEVIDVSFGYMADYNHTSLVAVGEEQGIWEEHGLNVTALTFNNGPLQIQALGTGDLDFGTIGPGAFWLPASGQADVIALNSLGNADRVIAQPGIDSMEDLRGKTVAVPEGTSGDMILTLALDDAGMTRDDIEVVPMDPSGVVTAFASNQVDGAGIWYPAISTINEQIPDLVELAKNADFEDVMAFPTAVLTSPGFAEDEPEMVERMTAALRDVLQWRFENPEETIVLVAEYLNLTEQQVQDDVANVQILSTDELDEWSSDGTIDGWLGAMNSYFVESGQLEDPLDPSEYYLGEHFVNAGQ